MIQSTTKDTSYKWWVNPIHILFNNLCCIFYRESRNSSSASHLGAASNTRQQRGSKPSIRQGKTTHSRTSSSANNSSRTIDALSVTGAANVGSGQEQQKHDIRSEGLPQHSRSDQDHVGNHRQSPSVHQRTHVSARNPPEIQNGSIQTESAMSGLSHQMGGLAIGSSQMASPGRTGVGVAGPGWRPPPATLANERSHVSSIPLPREAAMTPVGNRYQISNSPASSRRPPLPDGGGGTGSGRERGRRNSRTESNRRGSRSSSASGRAGSRDRLQRESPIKLEVSEGCYSFIYTATLEKNFPYPGHEKLP